MESWNELDEWIARYRQGELSERDKCNLLRWLEASPVHEKQFRERLQMEVRVDAVGRWNKLDRMQENVWKRITPVLESRGRRLYAWGSGAAAAIAVLVGLFFVWQGQRVDKGKGDTFASVLQVEAGSAKAILVTPTGERVELREGENRQVADISGVGVIQDSIGGVRFEDKGMPGEGRCENNTIVVPRKGEYFVVLSDGTKVWLNSDSRLEFPNRFFGASREVKLEGEAYFEVVANTGKPFYVHVGGAKVRVLGTAFNVMAYGEEELTEVALLRGKVCLDTEKGACMLEPGEIVSLDRESGKTILRKGDVQSIVDWKTGKFNFEDMPLKELTVKLSRWYGVAFVFGDEEAKKLRFSGAVTKYRSLDYVLGMIAKTTNVEFAEKEGKVVIRVKI
ncbi:FecR family protein [Butyricimonas synergistica]|uniref:FecR family protein n=1 Tax=Butyricimonas synergistica TaxID=544644 RepID=UPI0003679B1C|nr:FecR domain-containing protein [Butyricimonas synergistica]